MNTIHVYKRQKNGRVVRSKSVNTVAKLKKSPGHCHSITTVTSDIKNDFLSYWKDKKIWELAHENPGWDLDKCITARWGFRNCPETGKQITSSEFGTLAHECMENMLIHLKEGSDYHSPYSPLCRPFIRALEASLLKPELMEHMVLDEKRRVGGTVDFIAKNAFDKYEIFDFKFRGSTRAYDKDLLQLAIAADITMKDLGLGYLPKCHSVVFNWEAGDMKIKAWGERETWEAVDIFDKLNDIYIWRNNL